MGVDARQVDLLFETAARHVREGELPSAQLALAWRGEVVASAAFGRVEVGGQVRDAGDQTLYVGFSTTKALTSVAAWRLMARGELETSATVASVVPEFGTLGKERVTIEQLMTHTSGFPEAPFHPLEWADQTRRAQRFATWRLDWEPGSRFVYHRGASFWTLAAVLERLAERDYREVVRDEVLRPLEIDGLVYGAPPELAGEAARVVHVGEAPPARQVASVGLKLPQDNAAGEAFNELYSTPEFTAVGVPGGGGLMTASGLALFYQALLEHRVVGEATQAEALRIRTGAMTDPMTGKAANRALGLVVAGDTDRPYRSFGYTNSPATFGHAGLGGQIAWADPASGRSFVFLTNGLDRNPLRMGMRGARLSTMAASCVT